MVLMALTYSSEVLKLFKVDFHLDFITELKKMQFGLVDCYT